jgi:hypothetical protein
MSGPSIDPISATKALASLIGLDHESSEANAAARAELDREELLETEYREMGLPPPSASRPRHPATIRARLLAWIGRR